MNRDWDINRSVDFLALQDQILHLSREKLGKYLRGSSSFEGVIDHLLARPGNQIRTEVTVGWGFCCDSRELLEALVEAALGIELIHEGSLVHDDVYDQSLERRGQAAIYSRFGLKTANNFGLYLIARGVSMLCQVQYKHNIRLELPQINQLASSQVMETLPPCNTFEAQQHKMAKLADGKTGVLFRLASVLGAALASAKCPDRDELDQAERFGEIIGRAYQIRDDIADFSDDREHGGHRWSDMVAGNWNWPTLLWAGQVDDWQVAVDRIESCRDNPRGAQQLADEIRASGALLQAKRALAGELQLAESVIEQSSRSPGRELLCQFVSRLKLS